MVDDVEQSDDETDTVVLPKWRACMSKRRAEAPLAQARTARLKRRAISGIKEM
jgi:hypothetical protein